MLSIQQKRGFTLIELMLVVVIIGILAAIVMPRLAGKTKRARVAAAQMTIQSVSTALESFELDLGRFPSTEEGLQSLLVKPATLAEEDEWNGPYLKSVPMDPWNRTLMYRSPGERNIDFDLVSFGPDGQENTEDDISNALLENSTS